MANTAIPGDELLRQRDVLAITKISRAHLYQLRRRGQFPKPRNARSKFPLWLRSDVEAWMRSLPVMEDAS